MVIKHLENKIRLVGIICTAFLAGCIIISVSSIWTARTMVTDAQKKVYVLDGISSLNMIDYFIHFINKSLHFFAGKNTSSINHRSDFAD